MKVTLNRQEFAEAVAWVTKAMPSRNLNPILSSVKITATGDDLTILGGGYEVTHKATLRPVVHDEGTAIIPGAVTRDLATALRGDEMELVFDEDKSGAILRAGRSTYRLPTAPVEDWPPMLVFPDALCAVEGTEFRSLVRTVKAFADDNSSFDTIRGIRIEAGDRELRTVATNRFVISTAATPIDSDATFGLQIPARHFDAALAGMTGTVTVGHDGATFGVRDDSREVVFRCIDAQFAAWRPHMRADHDLTFTADTVELTEAVKRAMIAAEKEAPLFFSITPGQVEITAGAPGNPDGAEIVDIDGDGQLDTSFGPMFLAAVLATIAGPRVEFGLLSDNRKPAVVTDPDDDTAMHVVMPRRPKK